MKPPRPPSLAAVLAAAVLAVLPPVATAAQESVLRGVVRGGDGTSVSAANVFLLPSLEGTSSDSAGAFELRTTLRGEATLVVQRMGYAERRVAVSLPSAAPVTVSLAARSVALEPIRVQVSAVGDDPSRAGVTLTPVQAVTTPGSAGDIYRALQTFPGVQSVNETAGLFVRGGDVAETKVLLDGTVVLSPYRLETPTGAAFGTFDPFLLRGVFFSSGGFSARYGDAMSGLVALETVGAPPRNTLGLSGSIAALSGSAALALPANAGLRVTGTRTSTGLLFRLNGRDDFEVAPEGTDLSMSLSINPSRGRELKLFGLRQADRVVGSADESSFHSTFSTDRTAELMVLSGKELHGDWAPAFSLSASRSEQIEEYRAYRLERRERFLQGRVELDWQARRTVVLRTGAELEQRTSSFSGFVPADPDDDAPGAAIRFLGSRVTGLRTGSWVESEWHPLERLQVTTGVRTDLSDLAGERTADPRLALAYRLRERVALTAAWGVYHQLPGPLGYDRVLGKPGLPPMRARHWIAGVVLGEVADEESPLLRLEAYHKRYDDLVQIGRGWQLGDEGRGITTGFDVFLRGSGPYDVRGRVSYSLLTGRRTDPNTGVWARSPYDITHSLVAVAEREWGRLRVGVAYRASTGAPFTEVTGADRVGDRWVPRYGTPFAARLPAFQRMDVSANWLHSLWQGNISAFYVSVSNVLDYRNVSGYRYNEDYTERVPAPGLFPRTVYFGVSTTTNW